jgi:hypothetical protein
MHQVLEKQNQSLQQEILLRTTRKKQLETLLENQNKLEEEAK